MMMQELVKYAEKVQYPEGELAPWQNEDLIACVFPLCPPPPHVWLLSSTSRERVSIFGVCALRGWDRALPPELQVQLADAMCWRTLYGRRDVEEAISKVHRVSFHQHIVRHMPLLFLLLSALSAVANNNIRHHHNHPPPPPPRASSLQNLLGVMEAVPVSSGFALGSANWILRTDNEKVDIHATHSNPRGSH